MVTVTVRVKVRLKVRVRVRVTVLVSASNMLPSGSYTIMACANDTLTACASKFKVPVAGCVGYTYPY